MEYRRMGRTGLKVSELCLGTMTFGHSADEEESRRIVDLAIDAGVNGQLICRQPLGAVSG